MGVKGLLPCLRSITRHVELEKYRGLTVAIDAMCWLHKGIFTGNVGALAKYQFMEQQVNDNVPIEKTSERQSKDPILASTVKRLNFDKHASHINRIDHQPENNHVDAMEAMSKCIDYVTRHSMQLQKKHGLEIILVIDGDSLPSKHAVNQKRRNDRAESYQEGLKAEKRGDNRQARKLFSRACSITYEMRHELIVQCRRFHIPFVVAPYEADAQLAKLAHSCDVDLVITEDSDLLAYGCPRVLFKIDFKTSKGEEIQLMSDLATNDPLSFRHWNHDMFVYMCILAGCDYCAGIPGIGIQTAHKLVRIHRKPQKIFNALKGNGKYPENYEELFWNAYRTFRHQRVFCSQKRVIENLFEIKEANDTKNLWEYLGPWIEPSIGIGIAEGLIHPRKRVPWDVANRKHKLLRSKPSISNTMPHGRHERKRVMERSPIGKKRSDNHISNTKLSDDKNIFSFFRPKKRNNNKKGPDRPPLQVIQIDQDSDANILPLHMDRDFNKSHHQPIPSNYHDYSSHLVSRNFEPISRNRQSHTRLRRKGASKAIRDLKKKLSLKKTKNRNKELENKDDPSRLMNSDYNVRESQQRKQDNHISIPIHSSGSSSNNHIFEVAQRLAQRNQYNDLIPSSDLTESIPMCDTNGDSVLLSNDDQGSSIDESRLKIDDYYTINSTNYLTDFSTLHETIAHSSQSHVFNDHVEEVSNGYGDLLHPEYSENLSSVDSFSKHSQHQSFSYDTSAQHQTVKTQQSVLTETTDFIQNQPLDAASLNPFEVCDEFENYQQHAKSQRCYPREPQYGEDLIFDHGQYSTLSHHEVNDDIQSGNNEIQNQLHYDKSVTENNEPCNEIDYFHFL